MGNGVSIPAKYIPSSVTYLAINKNRDDLKELSKKIKNVITYEDDEIPEELRSESSDDSSYSEEIYESDEDVYESDEDVYSSSMSGDIDSDDTIEFDD